LTYFWLNCAPWCSLLVFRTFCFAFSIKIFIWYCTYSFVLNKYISSLDFVNFDLLSTELWPFMNCKNPFLEFPPPWMKILNWNLIYDLFLDIYTLHVSSLMLDVLLTELCRLMECKNWLGFFPGLSNSYLDEGISVKFYTCLWYLHAKFEFRYTWPTSDRIIPMMKWKSKFSWLFAVLDEHFQLKDI
jgi:hypothetical protein